MSKMLLTHLNTLPYSKFILIDDSIEEQGFRIFNYILDSRRKLINCDVHYAICEGIYNRKLIPNIKTYNFTNCINETDSITLKNVVSSIQTPSVLFIDSLVHVLLKYDFESTYRLLRDIISNDNILQLVTIFHVDLMPDDRLLKYFQHLSTFTITVEPKFSFGRPRLIYIYKKSGGKVVRQVEEFYFERGALKTEAIKKLDAQKLVQESMQEIEPDKLTTFKISLEEDEKKAREELVLPYLPKDAERKEGEIFYQFDEIDDWDDEDPDDDLEI